LRIEHHLFQRIGVWALPSVEIVILSVLILAARCVNYQDVFVSGNVYFTDADCYARMTRVRMCEKNPGLIIRHPDFEQYPQGIASLTTAPLDYAILALAVMLKPFTSQPLDLAGAIISPLFGLLAGWFLWWWSRQMQFPFRACMLTLYALSLILVHGTELGRPDHQSLLIMLVLIAIAAEWRLQTEESRIWGAISGAAWGLAFWVSLYEPLILLLIVIGLGVLRDRHFFQAQHRRTGWILFTLIVALAVAIERHVLSLPFTQGEDYLRWSRTIGELMSVSPTNSIWFQWVGWLLIAAPLLIWLTLRRKTSADGPTRRPIPSLVLGLLGTTYLLTLWQTRWAYFFAAIFCLTIPTLLASISRRWIGWIIFYVGL
jgi:asparagine N-glycosylation enzyme membrane subunit Stt3